MPFTESIVEDATLTWLEELGYTPLYGPDLAAGMPAAERSDPNTKGMASASDHKAEMRP